jgi:hypothetical protein
MTHKFIFLLIISSFVQNLENCNDSMIEKITIKKVDFSIFTLVSVKCEDFENHFNNQYSISTLKTRKDIDSFLAIFINSPLLDSSFNNYVVDTRVKVEVYYKGGEVKSICIGNPAYKKDGFLYQNTDTIKKYIEDIEPD